MSADGIQKCISGCHCGKGCNGCPFDLNPPGGLNQLRYSESTSATTETLVFGVAPVKMHYEVSDMGFGAEGGCKCGPNCKCNPCNC